MVNLEKMFNWTSVTVAGAGVGTICMGYACNSELAIDSGLMILILDSAVNIGVRGYDFIRDYSNSTHK